jgi:hypothetical protein
MRTCLFALGIILMLAGAMNAFAQGGLVARYTFEGGSYADSSGNNLNGTAMGNATIVFDADRNSNVVSLDGTTGTYVDLGNDTLFDWHGAWSAAFWVKLRTWDEGWDTFLKKDNAFSFERDQSFEKLAFYHWPNWTPTAVDLTPDGKWHHIAVTLDGTKQSFYLDGQLWTAADNIGAFNKNTKHVMLGSADGTSRFIDASFDELQIYSKSLTKNEVAKLANYTPPPSPIVAHYSFEGGYIDSSDNGFTAIPHGNATIVTDADRGNKVISLDGTSGTYLEFGNDTLFNWQGGWSVAFWTKVRNWPGGWATLLKKGDAYSFERDQTHDSLAFYHWPNWTNTRSRFTNDDKWHHVAATLDGKNQKLYIDGQLVANVANAGNFNKNTNPVILGSDGGTGRFVDASFDEIYFYREALSSSQIRMLANAAAVKGDLVLFHFDGDFQNAAATGDTATPYGNVSFVNGLAGHGKALYLNNTATTDTSYLTFPDMNELHITGDFMVQGWFKYADTSVVARTNPAYIVSKADATGKYNFRVSSDLSGPGVTGGFTSANQGSWVSDPAATATLASKGDFADKWYRFTYMRDSVLQGVALAIHDSAGNLVSYGFRQVHPAYALPQTSTLPLLIGRSRLVANNLFNGYLDDIRISNTLVSVDIPPVILYPQYLSDPRWSPKIGNQDASLNQYPVSAYIAVPGTPNGVATAKVRYHTVTNPYERVATGDVRWQEVTMTKGAGDLYTGNIPKQAFGTVVDYYIMATSTTGKTTTFGANPDSTYDRFGVWNQHDRVLSLSFEQSDMNFIDSSAYHHQLKMAGDWALWDDPSTQIEGSFCAYLPEGSFAMGEIVSPFLSTDQYTVTVWLKPVPSKMPHNVYILSNTPSSYNNDMTVNNGPWYMPNYTMLQRYDRINNDVVQENRSPVEFPWHGDKSYIAADTLGNWAHYLISCGPDSLVVQRNNQFDQPVARQVYKGPLGAGWENPFKPFAPSIGRFRIGPPGAPDATPFYTGYMDKVEVYNYQTYPGHFADAMTSVEQTSNEIPLQYALSQNYPNPFNPSTTINYDLAHSGDVRIVIYNMLGQKVIELVNQTQPAGRYTVRWEGRDDHGASVSSGVYFYQMRAGSFTKVNKMMLLK